jgi:hypothetical protein
MFPENCLFHSLRKNRTQTLILQGPSQHHSIVQKTIVQKEKKEGKQSLSQYEIYPTSPHLLLNVRNYQGEWL